ncbi:hypothetical protein DXB95_05100 [Streptococcus ilei]|uniref:hypothetical protein n=1 Tax=Streptococcus ilei TaxID=1156431 RepID=UPI000E4447BF|nr:hypothetical protein [Streptococcus ilei]RGM74521.1 hypothetical protein DXB95_05100 [Streptococcus ilei]
MSSLITMLIISVIFTIYYAFAKNRFRKYDNSPVNKRIDLIYSRWYKTSAYLLNRKSTTIYEIDKLLYSLKTELMNVGISKEDIESYINMLRSYKANIQFGFKDVIIGMFTFFTTESYIKIISQNWNNIEKQINCYLSKPKNVDNLLTALFILLGTIAMFAIIWVISKIATLDTMHKKSQRLFTLNGLIKMWDYEEDQIVEKIEDIDKSKEKIVYVNLKFGKSKSDELIDKSLGENTYNYFNMIYDWFTQKLNNISVKIVQFIQFIIAILLPNIFGFSLSLISSIFIYVWISEIPSVLKVIILICLSILLILLFMIYFSLFKSTYEKYKKIVINSDNTSTKKCSGINCIQVFLIVLFYIYLACLAFNIHPIYSICMLIPIFPIVLAIFWSPSRT